MIDLAQFSHDVGALLDEFRQGDIAYMVQATHWNHRHGDQAPTIAIYLTMAFRREASTFAEALAKVRSELVVRFGEPL